MNALRGLALTAALSAVSCRSPAACAPPASPLLLGSWKYTATQTGANAVNGTLQITSQCGQQFGGTLDVTQLDASGVLRRLAGVVSGTLVDTLVDFDAYLDATPRRHDAAVHADSMVRGQWIEQTGTVTLSGSFTSAWTSP